MITHEKLMMTHESIVDECLKLQTSWKPTFLSTLIVKTARIMTPSSNSETDNWLYMDQSYHAYDLLKKYKHNKK